MLKFPFYRGDRDGPVSEGHKSLPRFTDTRHLNPESYIPDPKLRDAVNVALLLNQPLLLTGEPGTGKTQLAYSVAWELGFGEPLKFETKSTSVARDLFYVYDALGRFHQGHETTSALSYITFNALGIAILKASEKTVAQKYLPEKSAPESPRRSVVLIDEIDKAPRDFPNDVLNELEGMYFRIPELENIEIRAQSEHPPVVIITSNSEKHLPDPFLRRCVYYHIPFPDDKERLGPIIMARLGKGLLGDDQFLDDALDVFFAIRKGKGTIQKKPSTAELLGWMLALRRIAGEGKNPLRALDDAQILGTTGALLKNQEDSKAATPIVQKWLDNRKNDGSSKPNG